MKEEALAKVMVPGIWQKRESPARSLASAVCPGLTCTDVEEPLLKTYLLKTCTV
jgi:hypothetical protein